MQLRSSQEAGSRFDWKLTKNCFLPGNTTPLSAEPSVGLQLELTVQGHQHLGKTLPQPHFWGIWEALNAEMCTIL